jgi:hypothetical protein
MQFFELSEYQAHKVLRYGAHGRTIEGRAAAKVVRAIAARVTEVCCFALRGIVV